MEKGVEIFFSLSLSLPLYFILFRGLCLYWAHINSSDPFMHFNSVALSRHSTYFICNPPYLEPEILACQGK